MLIRIFLLLTTLLFNSIAYSASIFTDTFNSDATGLNTVPTGWQITNGGTVDVIGSGFFDFLPGNGDYIDLDGTSKKAGEISHTLNLTAGLKYVASFSLAGNHRNAGLEDVTVNFGSTANTISLTANQDFTVFSMVFKPTTTGIYTLSFLDNSQDDIGALLDNASVNVVPVPAAIWLFCSALAGISFLGKRRKSA